MNEILIAASVVAIVVLIAISVWLFETRNECRHSWGGWDAKETEYAYVQERVCKKCGYHQITQFKKLKSKD
jgi:hypothetical protein